MSCQIVSFSFNYYLYMDVTQVTNDALPSTRGGTTKQSRIKERTGLLRASQWRYKQTHCRHVELVSTAPKAINKGGG